MTEQTLMACHSTGNEDLKHVITRIGALMRTLRESMRELGLEKSVQQAVASIPDGKDRLRYVAQMTAQAAEKTLNGIDVIKPLQAKMHDAAVNLQQQWQSVDSAEIPVQLHQSTQVFLNQVINDSNTIKTELLEIMMAQDFQDLTGQVIKKMMEVVEEAETQLLALLMENTPPEMRVKQHNDSLLNGPQINKEGINVMASQSQVDDLLDELGF